MIFLVFVFISGTLPVTVLFRWFVSVSDVAGVSPPPFLHSLSSMSMSRSESLSDESDSIDSSEHSLLDLLE